MKRCPKLSDLQKKELELFIQVSGDVKEVRRSQCVLLVDSEVAYSQIEILTGFRERSVLIFRQRYLRSGLKGLEHKRKGKPKVLLSPFQRDEIIHFLKNTSPIDHGYKEHYWSTLILGDFIQRKYDVIYKTKKTFYLLFEEAKMSFHKSGQVYENHDKKGFKLGKKR